MARAALKAAMQCLSDISAVAAFCPDHGVKEEGPAPPSGPCADLFEGPCARDAASGQSQACAQCVATHIGASKIKCANPTGVAAVAGFCGSTGKPGTGPPPPAPPPPFNPLACYYDVCPSGYDDAEDHSQLPGMDEGGLYAELVGEGDGLRRQLQGRYGSSSACPEKIEGIELEGWGYFWITFVVITCVTIAIASTPAPFGLDGRLAAAKRAFSTGEGTPLRSVSANVPVQVARTTGADSISAPLIPPGTIIGVDSSVEVGSAGSVQGAAAAALTLAPLSAPTNSAKPSWKIRMLEIAHCW